MADWILPNCYTGDDCIPVGVRMAFFMETKISTKRTTSSR